MLRKLADAGEIREDQGAEDRRHKSLSLTDKGRQTVGTIHEYGSAQVRDPCTYPDEREQVAVRAGLHTYARRWSTSGAGASPSTARTSPMKRAFAGSWSAPEPGALGSGADSCRMP